MGLTTQARFGGVWTVARDIEDLAGGPSGRFRGLARITPDGDGLRYAEQGALTLGAAKMMASRVYLWRLDGPTGVQVLFEDGAPFHRFDWGRIESTDEHQCGADHYAVRYSFVAETWHAHWRVTGPRKNYASSARYLRPTPPETAG
jgi:hypothetical protein